LIFYQFIRHALTDRREKVKEKELWPAWEATFTSQFFNSSELLCLQYQDWTAIRSSGPGSGLTEKTQTQTEHDDEGKKPVGSDFCLKKSVSDDQSGDDNDCADPIISDEKPIPEQTKFLQIIHLQPI
jgi:hypothetical protein